ncbi:MAG: substrate-binding domain-containing protein [Betaproteobacteria bacterium]|nr:substrate-binding domain-containing protein [Betaproteobacteria bacterium]
MKTMLRTLSLLLAVLASAAHAQGRDIRLATTTSTENSGLLKVILPLFEAKYGGKVRVISVGTGAALKLGENGDADVVLVHARPLEDKFIAAGFGSLRKDVMYNDFIIVGPQRDPAGVRGAKDAIAAMKKISASGARFISRGDESGTHQMEKDYWRGAGITPRGTWYLSTGQGMGQVLTMAAQLEGYALTDRATYAAYKDKTGLDTLVEGDPRMFNPYGVIVVNPQRHPHINHAGALALADWLTSAEGQQAIVAFTINGVQMFFPGAK